MKKITRISLIGIALASIGLVIVTLSNFGGLRSSGGLESVTRTPFSEQSTYTPEPSSTPLPTITSTPTITPTVILEPEPLVIEFEAEDGQQLSGFYYPADHNPAPLVVLINWAKGNQSDWEDIAVWLQNRVEVDQTPDYNYSWRSGNWFPDNHREETLAVFTYDFRECTAEGCQSFLPLEWLLDAQAAVQTGASLQGVDSSKILVAGASMGGDAAVYACNWLNQQENGACVGAFVLSPGSFLTLPFEDQIEGLINERPGMAMPIYCLYGLRDDAAVETCSELPGLTQYDFGYIEKHGFELIQPLQSPDPLNLMLEFIDIGLGVAGGGEE
jgi:dienelactone hydrolase